MAEEKTRIKDIPTEIQQVESDDFVAVDGSSGTRKIKADKLSKVPSFFATYGTSTYSEISSAINKGLCVFCRSQGNIYVLMNDYAGNFKFARSEKSGNKIYLEYVQVSSENEWTNKNVEVAKSSDIPSNVVSSTDITSILKVSALPDDPDPNTLYLVVEEEATTASETSETEGEV